MELNQVEWTRELTLYSCYNPEHVKNISNFFGEQKENANFAVK